MRHLSMRRGPPSGACPFVAPRTFGSSGLAYSAAAKRSPGTLRRRSGNLAMAAAARRTCFDFRSAARKLLRRRHCPTLSGRINWKSTSSEGKRIGQRPDSKSGAGKPVGGSSPLPSAPRSVRWAPGSVSSFSPLNSGTAPFPGAIPPRAMPSSAWACSPPPIQNPKSPSRHPFVIHHSDFVIQPFPSPSPAFGFRIFLLPSSIRHSSF
jgi:hypothetical protein